MEDIIGQAKATQIQELDQPNCQSSLSMPKLFCFAQFRHALISITRGNLYGIADHTTPLYEDYARGAMQDWEIALRKVIKRVLRLPKGYPNNLLHKVTGIPSIATLLNQKIVERLQTLHKGLEG